MNPSPVRSWVVLTAVAAVALCAQEWLAPAIAKASCGDYVVMVGSGGQAVHDVNSNNTPPRTHGPLPCGSCPQAPGKAPCQGPWCSDNHSPAPMPTTSIERLAETWVSLSSLLGLADLASAPHALAAERFARIHHVRPIDPPPRQV